MEGDKDFWEGWVLPLAEATQFKTWETSSKQASKQARRFLIAVIHGLLSHLNQVKENPTCKYKIFRFLLQEGCIDLQPLRQRII